MQTLKTKVVERNGFFFVTQRVKHPVSGRMVQQTIAHLGRFQTPEAALAGYDDEIPKAERAASKLKRKGGLELVFAAGYLKDLKARRDELRRYIDAEGERSQ